MCGRFTLTTPAELLRDRFDLTDLPTDYAATYNAAPAQRLIVVTSDAPATGQRYRWGLIPAWAKATNVGYKMINARAETLAEKPTYRPLLGRQHCFVLADGFYEWRRTEQGKQPYRFRLHSGEPFAFAGLWARWTDRTTGEVIPTFTIVTTEANAMVAPVHARMPVMLPAERAHAWLDADAASWATTLSTVPADHLEAYPVSDLVNSPRNNAPELIEPAAL